MSFLHGVLETVKDDDNVTKYDDKNTNKNINSVIKTLHDNVGKGRQAFRVAVSQVDKATGAVKDKLGELITKLSSGVAGNENFYNQVKEQAEQPLASQLAAWKETLSSISSALRDDVETKVNELDSALKGRIEAEMKPITKVVEHMQNSASDEVRAACQGVDRQLDEREKEIMSHITENCEGLLEASYEQFANVFENVNELQRARSEQFEHIKTFIKYVNDAVADVIKNYDKNYEEHVSTQFKKIRDELQDVDTEKNAKGTAQATSHLRKIATHVKKNIETLDNDLNKAAKKLGESICGAVDGVEGALSKLDGKVQGDLNRIENSVKKQLTDYAKGYVKLVKQEVEKIKRGVGEKDGTKNGNDGSICYNWDLLKAISNTLVKAINGTGLNRSGLTQIVDGVEAYARKFTEGNFESTVQKWIADILTQDVVAKKYVKDYVEYNKGHGKQLVKVSQLQSTIAEAADMHPKIIDAIMKALQQELNGAGGEVTRNIREITTQTPDKIQKYVQAVQAGINHFVSGINGKLDETSKNPGMESFVDDIVRNIGTQVKAKDETSYSPYTLVGAVRATLITLSSTARQVASQLEIFRATSNIANVEGAITNANKIGKQFADNSGIRLGPSEFGLKIQRTLPIVQQQLKDLSNNLTKATGDDSLTSTEGIDIKNEIHETIATKITEKFDRPVQAGDAGPRIYDLSTVLPEYNRWVKGTDSDPNNLRAKIDKIKKDLGEYFNNGEKIDGSSTFKLWKSGIFQDYVYNRFSASNAIKSALDKIEQLEKVPGDVESKRKKTMELMKDLKHNFQQIKNEIERAYRIVTDADIVLQKHIQSVSDVAFSAQDTISRTIQTLQKDLTETAKNAFEEITVQVRLLFAHSRTADLTALKSLVNAQKTAIEGIITKDLANGVKGLLDKIRTTHQILGPIKDQKDLNLGTPIFKQFYEGLWSYIIGQIANHPSKDKASKVNTALTELLQKMIKENHFSHEVADLIKKAADTVVNFTPAKFTSPSSPILQALKDGIGALAQQLGYAYVSTYCCKKFDGALLDPDTSLTDDKRKLTPYGEKLSKVFMTCLPGWTRYLYDLRVRCHNNPQGPWNSLQINKLGKHKSLGDWFDSRGYRVSKEDNGHDGELKNKIDFTGEQIRILLGHKLNKLDSKLLTHLQSLKLSNGQYTTLPYLLRYVSGTLDDYRSVCHYNIPPKPRAPSNIYLMLQWTAGLKYNHMYGEVKSQLGNVLKGLQNEHKLETEALPVAVQSDMRGLITSPIDYDQLTKALESVCHYAEQTLVAVLGHGHADGVYASDHLTNSSNLLYPGSGGACLDMLVDVLFRLYQQMCFLRKQCLGGKSHSGWKDCSYGRYVAGSGWQCNNEQCANLECNLRPNQKGNLSADQTLKQTADQHPDCGMKSPLQSFLEDGLQGFLPHSFSSPGCKLTCTVSNHRGLPCKTPMGFADIGVIASHTKTGAYLERVLFDFCGPYSALSKLCNMLNCVLRRAPQTLDDIFGFFRGYLANWIEGREHKISAFNKAIKEAYFGQEYSDLTPTVLFNTSVHQWNDISNHSKGDMFTITKCENRAVDTCGVYLESVSSSTYSIFSSYHKKQYLSWILYSAETLYNLLDRLYKQCCNNCTSPGAKCHGTKCDKNCQVKQAYDAQNSDDAKPDTKRLDGKNHTENCSSIVRCQNTLPTLYMYGFSFGNPFGLCGKDNLTVNRRTCKDFCSALKKILDEESALIQLIKQIDEFIWKIRENFSYTLLALWSLSLLYLLHIAVVRLDVLRIRSHLRSPSSHRIAAQSLLAAARVRALANVKYFSP
ncbi:hypothetical protein, conserved [Babesia ovata]|uniref:C3H1-type domain-containing protein n=1 Tax=Babesia ovata TaxID=189622 RepID=A0A2H6KJZ6_9APIC|nr:uncharacterized protein BOVATA_048180 [Babesia ovata]GBE63325.1 hypothetical protein, conserved [Babesia ovata]